MTITIQIGNSDDKLTQREWSAFVISVRGAIAGLATNTHFFGASESFSIWQNAAWVIDCGEESAEILKAKLKEMRHHWRQDSIAWTEGTTEFI